MAKRDDILIATLDLISEVGLQSTTFSKIFKRANVGSGTVYNYFKNKEELVGALYIKNIDHFSEVILQNYDSTETVFECFKRFLTNMACFAHEFPKELWFMENYSHSPYLADEIKNREIPAMTECMALIQRGMEQGLIRKIHPMLCVQIVNGMLISAIQGALLGKYEMDEEQFGKVVDICWRAIII